MKLSASAANTLAGIATRLHVTDYGRRYGEEFCRPVRTLIKVGLATTGPQIGDIITVQLTEAGRNHPVAVAARKNYERHLAEACAYLSRLQ